MASPRDHNNSEAGRVGQSARRRGRIRLAKHQLLTLNSSRQDEGNLPRLGSTNCQIVPLCIKSIGFDAAAADCWSTDTIKLWFILIPAPLSRTLPNAVAA
jgi:hypothetical protein